MEVKNKKIISKILNILSIIVGVLVLIVAISAITSSSKGYTSFFGVSPYAVKSNSMKGDKTDSFNKGDLIFVKVLNDEQKQKLEVGQITTFFTLIDGKQQLNTHRIIDVRETGGKIVYVTQGDNKDPNNDGIEDVIPTETVLFSDVVGVYSFKMPVVGNLILAIQSPTGFLLMVVLPSLLVVSYCAYVVVKNYKGYNKERKADEIEKLKQQILKDMETQAINNNSININIDNDNKNKNQ